MKLVEYVEMMLKNFRYINGVIERLKIELEDFEEETLDETMESLNSRQSQDNDKVQSSCITDRTHLIAMIYRGVNSKTNRYGKKQLAALIRANEKELNKIKRCVESLKPSLYYVINGLYIEGLSWSALGDEMLLSRNAIAYRRKKGIELIVEMLALDAPSSLNMVI